jgi:hypothetical protein
VCVLEPYREGVTVFPWQRFRTYYKADGDIHCCVSLARMVTRTRNVTRTLSSLLYPTWRMPTAQRGLSLEMDQIAFLHLRFNCEVVPLGLVFLRVLGVFTVNIISTNAALSSSGTCSCYQKEKRTKPGSLPKSSSLLEIGEHQIENYYHFFFVLKE